MSIQYRPLGGSYHNTGSPGTYQSAGTYTNGSIPTGSGYPSMVGSNGSGFTFRKRVERVDWKKIAAADLDHISRNLDFNPLQENIMNITFCNIESELDVGTVDPHFVKLFKLAQLTVEYLLHSQDYLSGMVAALDEKLQKAMEEHGSTKEMVEKQKTELAEVKKESHKRKKMLVAQQQIMNAGVNSYHKCPYCPKAFVNTTFLHSHLQRRHTEQVPQYNSVVGSQASGPPQPPLHSQMAQSQGQVSEEYKALEHELDDIKERLHMTESQLVEERNIRNSLNQKEQAEIARREMLNHEEMEAWKKEQLDGQKSEIERVRDMFMKELKEMNEKYASAEKALTNLQKKGVSNLGAMEDEAEVDRKQLRKQREEVAMLKEQLQAQVANVESEMVSKFDDQEARWREKVKEMGKQHREELKQLNNVFKSSVQDFQVEQEDRGKLEDDYNKKMAEMQQAIKQSQEQDKKLKAHERQIEEIAKKTAAPVAAQRPPVKTDSRQRSAPPVAPRPMSPEDDDEEDEDEVDYSELEATSSLGTGLASGPFIGEGTLSLGTGTINSKSIRLLEQLKQDPSLLRALKEELHSVLDDNLEKRGIPKTATGISSSSLTNKLSVLKTERQQLAKKFSNFYDIRQQYIRQVDEQAKEQLRSQKKSAGSKPRASTSAPHRMPPRPMSPSRPISPAQGKGHRPLPAPRAASPLGKMGTMSTMTSTGTYATTTGTNGMNTWGTTTATSSGNWGSDAESDDQVDGARAHGTKTSGSQQKKTSVMMREEEDEEEDEEEEEEESDWDDGSVLDDSPRKTVQRVISSPQPRGEKVTALRDKIESQLANRESESPKSKRRPIKKGRGKKPLGGVSTVEMEDDRSQHSKKKDDSWDDDDDFSISSLEDTASAPPSRTGSVHRRHPPTRGSHQDTDVSTAGTSIWGSSKGSSANRGVTLGSGGRTSVMSLSDFDEDNDDLSGYD